MNAETEHAAHGPGENTGAAAAADAGVAQATCEYLGQTFFEGDTICYQGQEYRCSGGAWVETGNAC